GIPNLTFERSRAPLYSAVLGPHQDSMLALWETALTAPGPQTPARLSLVPGFTRRWPSAYDAVLDGGLDPAAARTLLADAAAGPPGRPRPSRRPPRCCAMSCRLSRLAPPGRSWSSTPAMPPRPSWPRPGQRRRVGRGGGPARAGPADPRAPRPGVLPGADRR